MTGHENIKHSWDIGLRKIPENKHSRKPILIIELNKEFESMVLCAKYLIENKLTRTLNIDSVVRSINYVTTKQKEKYLKLTFEYKNQ